MSAICLRFCGTPAVNVGNEFLIAANADPAIPLAEFNKLSAPPVRFFANPFNDPAIELNPPVTVLAKLPAKLPAPNKVDALPNSLFAAPPKLAIGPVIDCPNAPAADLIAFTAAAGPASAAAVTMPAICPADSLPVITPACVICVCAV